MKKIFFAYLGILIIATNCLTLVSCNEINYLTLPKDLSMWNINPTTGIFNPSLINEVLNKNNDDKNSLFLPLNFNATNVLKTCYPGGGKKPDPTDKTCYLNVNSFVIDELAIYELKTKPYTNDSFLSVSADGKIDNQATIVKINNMLSFSFTIDDADRYPSNIDNKDKDNKYLVKIKDNEENAPGEFSLLVLFQVKITASHPSIYKNETKNIYVMIEKDFY